MSSLATATDNPSAETAATAGAQRGAPRLAIDLAVGLALAAGFALIAFLTTGGTDLAPNTWVEIALTTIGLGLVGAAVTRGWGRPPGTAPLALFAALTVLTYASIAWSVQPANSWIEADRTLSYLGAFAGAAALARLAPARSRAIVAAIGLFATALSAYALLVKVFPGTFDRTDSLGRLHAPFGYWNATGLVAAMGLPACLWVGTRTDGSRLLRALAVPAIGILWITLVLSYSRSVLLATAVGLACWFVLVPLRLRSALVLALGSVGAAAVIVWALETHSLTHDRIPLHARTSAGHTFGLLLIALIVLSACAGVIAAREADRRALSERARRRIGTGLVVLVALAPIGAVIALAASSRGLTGEISHVWSTLINPNSKVGDQPGRLVELGSSRPRYWSDGIKVGEHNLLHGAGALGYATARTRYSSDHSPAQHAHSYVVETFADFGLIGLALSLALLVAWGLAARRAVMASTAVGPAEPAAAELSRQRASIVALLAVVAIFGVHSLIDWTWFIPGAAVPALVCAGWLAGRGRLDAARRPARHIAAPALAASAAVLSVLALLAAWFTWQPLRSADADGAALTAITNGDAPAALTHARAAAASDPLSVDPLWLQAEIYIATGDPTAARRALVDATSLQPQNAETWSRLGEFDLAHDRARDALADLEKARRLDRTSGRISSLLRHARAATH